MNDYLVSALVPTYNAGRFMRGLLEDLEQQTIAEQTQIIIVDTASPTNEKEIVEEFLQKYKNIDYVRTDHKENSHEATIRAMKRATGKYITLSCTDDRHQKNAFERMVTVLESRPDIALVYANVYVTTKENETFDKFTCSGKYRWFDYDPWKLLYCCFMGPQPMWRRSLSEKYGYFDGSFESAGDWEYWLRMAGNENFLHIDEFLGLYLYSPNSSEHKNPRVTQKEAGIVHNKYINRERVLREKHFKAREAQGIIGIKSKNENFRIDLKKQKPNEYFTETIIYIARDQEPASKIENCVRRLRKFLTPSSDLAIRIARANDNVLENEHKVKVSPKSLTLQNALDQGIRWEAKYLLFVDPAFKMSNDMVSTMISKIDNELEIVAIHPQVEKSEKISFLLLNTKMIRACGWNGQYNYFSISDILSYFKQHSFKFENQNGKYVIIRKVETTKNMLDVAKVEHADTHVNTEILTEENDLHTLKDQVKEQLVHGERLLITGQYKNAEDVFQKIIQDNGNLVQAYNNLACVMWHTGRRTEAIDELKKAIQISPGNTEAVWNLGQFLKELGQTREAKRLLKEYLQKNPDQEDMVEVLSEWEKY